ncbi:hypothetical protein ACVG01_12255 [Pseudomonas aeruginosa]
MGKGRTIFGVVASVIYVLWIGTIIAQKYGELSSLELNELGDFFAGIFGPVAFLWLVLGYFQQGNELRLQAQELRNSVEQQRELVAVTREQVTAELENSRFAREQRAQAIRPFFIGEGSGGSHSGNHHKLDFAVKNLGAPITRVDFEFDGVMSLLSKKSHLMSNGDIARFTYEFHGTGEGIGDLLTITYFDQDGSPGAFKFKVWITTDGEHPRMKIEPQ